MARTKFSIYDMDGYSNEELLNMSSAKVNDEVEEPFDPAYLTDEPYEIPDISSYEKKFNRKISIIENKLKKNHISFEWLEQHEMFRVGKKRQGDNGEMSDYYTYQYIAVYMETNEYAFGGWEEDRCVSTRISDVIASVNEWLRNNEPGLK